MSSRSHNISKWASAVLLPALLTFHLGAAAQTSGFNSSASTSVFTRIATPNLGPNNLLESMSADSEQDIWAVGDFVSLNFNGTAWKAIPLALPAGEATMNGISAQSPSDVWAVGSTVVNNHLISVTEHFDGKKWSIVPSPQFASGSQLFKVFAVASDSVYAVGALSTDTQLQGKPLIEHFDGTKWSVVSLPLAIKNTRAELVNIAGLSATDIWMIGNVVTGSPLVLHFDGQNFTRVPFPGSKVFLSGITLIASNDAWITGSNGGTLAAHWDGNAWKRVASPSGPAGSSSGLAAVAAVSSADVWAAGGINQPGVGFLNLVEHWDGTQWTINPIQTSKQAFDELNAALAFPSGSVFVAGTRLHCDTTICGGFDSVVFHTMD
ncbi:MAG TPA: hypothetical protein VMT75_11785 [Candidatus Saccharimonadales bacterium]|nr:hypothetical protein [Candidatus Saccharimonadales bacterium]